MNYRLLMCIFLVVLSFTSCIPTKKITYLQESQQAVDSLMHMQRVQKPYRIQINDLISIRVKALDQNVVGMFNPVDEGNINATGEERLYYDGFAVDDHGNIRIPTLGEMNVLGYTVDEVREMIETELLEKYFKNEANIFVTVKLAGIRYTTLGEIGTGSQVVYKETVNIMEAIANAGGITEYGDYTKIKIIRQTPGGEEIHRLDVTSTDVMNDPFYYIQPNDLIIVDPLPQKALGVGTTGLGTFRDIVGVVTLLTSIILIVTR